MPEGASCCQRPPPNATTCICLEAEQDAVPQKPLPGPWESPPSVFTLFKGRGGGRGLWTPQLP